MAKVKNEKEVKFPNNLAKYREKKGLDVVAMSVRLGVAHASLYLWEDGVRFPRSAKIVIPLIEREYGATKEDLWPTVYR